MTDQTPPPPPPPPPPPGPGGSTWSDTGAADVQGQVQRAGARGGGATAWQGGGTIWNEPVLVINQKAKLIEVTNEYNVYDQNGTQLAVVRQTGQSGLRKLLRVLTSFDQFLTHRLEVYAPDGSVQMRLTRPGKIFKSQIIVADAGGAEVGRVVQENVFGKKRFRLVAAGQQYGRIQAENWRAWDFAIVDHAGTEVARVTKTWEGLGKAMFTTADHYVLHLHRPLDDPLRWLVIASALSIDTALKQDSSGFN
ncbi:MAG: scramblase [Actinobacteria bacterium]|nr:scramblase [Actinomycetota bacterium]